MPQEFQTIAILFADIGGSTRLYERVGDVEAHRRVAESLAFMKQAIVANQGVLLRTVGDASLASFDTCDDALLAACEMQLLHKTSPLSVRVGFHYGPVIPDKGDVYGSAVNIAARIASFARTDEITATQYSVECLSEGNRARATLLDRITVKGIDEPFGVYRISWQERDDSTTIVASPFQQNSSDFLQSKLELRIGERLIVIDHSSASLSIGRADDNGLPVDSEQASRRHAKIDWFQGQFLLTDESTNGTFIKKDVRNPLFVRRETVVLEGTGMMGIGAMPQTEDNNVIHFIVRNA